MCSTKPCLEDTSKIRTGILRCPYLSPGPFLPGGCHRPRVAEYPPSPSPSRVPMNFTARATSPLHQTHQKWSSRVQQQTVGRRGTVCPRAAEWGPAKVTGWPALIGGFSGLPRVGAQLLLSSWSSGLPLNLKSDQVLVFLLMALRTSSEETVLLVRRDLGKLAAWGENTLWSFFPQITTRIIGFVVRNNGEGSASPTSGSPWSD